MSLALTRITLILSPSAYYIANEQTGLSLQGHCAQKVRSWELSAIPWLMTRRNRTDIIRRQDHQRPTSRPCTTQRQATGWPSREIPHHPT